ncbi:30S ribosomal protein S18 [Candidatus Peregrinibacteria bacterium]|nr:30S ribosomal protein S18 [Candidatus Peregrinibacteria bacterium]
MAKNKYNKPCPFTAAGIQYIDYKDFKMLVKYVSQYGKIVPRYYTGVCLKQQKSLARAIKRARIMGLLAFTGKRTLS